MLWGQLLRPEQWLDLTGVAVWKDDPALIFPAGLTAPDVPVAGPVKNRGSAPFFYPLLLSATQESPEGADSGEIFRMRRLKFACRIATRSYCAVGRPADLISTSCVCLRRISRPGCVTLDVSLQNND